jgi:hypothetical protein
MLCAFGPRLLKAGVSEDMVRDLRMWHFGPDARDLRPPGDLEAGYARACYDCLLSYTNQRDHFRLAVDHKT